MNAIENEAHRREHVETIARLLKEYAEKLDATLPALLNAVKQFAMSDYTDKVSFTLALTYLNRFEALSPSLERLTRAASQAIEHFDLEPLQELELKLRMDEVELILTGMEEVVKLVRKWNPKLAVRE